MSVLGFTTVMIGVFVTICGVPRANRRLYEAGGALFITGGKHSWLIMHSVLLPSSFSIPAVLQSFISSVSFLPSFIRRIADTIVYSVLLANLFAFSMC